MKLSIIFTIFWICSTSDCSAQKGSEVVRKFPDVLAFDSSGNYMGPKRWELLTTTKTLSISFTVGDTIKMVLQKLHIMGYFAVTIDGTQTDYKVGRWQSVVPGTANLRLSEGDYSLGKFKKCCEAGYCTGYYSYKTGYWKFYYSNGQIMACGTFITIPVEMNTGCGNQIVRQSKISSDWKFYNSDGYQIATDADLISAIESFEILQ